MAMLNNQRVSSTSQGQRCPRFLLTILMTGYLKERKRLAESEQAG